MAMPGKTLVHPIPLTFRPMVPSRLHRFQQSAVPKGHGLDVEPGLKLRTTPYFNMYQLVPSCLSILQKCCLQVLQKNIITELVTSFCATQQEPTDSKDS